MVFEPTFESIDDDAQDLPDLDGGEDAGEAEPTLAGGDPPADDLPPLGA